jgi:hypothetical protein
MANKTLNYGDLRVTLTSAYDLRWNDSGSGANRDGGFWHPKPQGNMRPVGSVAVPHHGDINNQWAVLLVGDNIDARPADKGAAVVPPVDYDGPLWTDRGSGAHSDGSFWRPKAPQGYIALGDVASSGYGKPGLDQIWCIRADLVSDGAYKETKEGAAISVWDDMGSGAKSDASFWEIIPRKSNAASGYIPVLAGTFRCSPGYSPADASLAKVPALYVPKPNKRFSPSPPQVTKDTIPELNDTYDQTATCAVTLPFTCFFEPSDRAGLDAISNPFCTVTKQVSWIVKEKFPNYQQTAYTQTQTLTTGVKTSSSTTTTNSAGLSISSEFGYGLAKWSVSLNYQFTLSQTNSFEEVQQRTMSKTITVAPHTMAIAWAKRVSIQGVRDADGSRIDSEANFDASEEIAVTDFSLQ